MVWGCFSPGGVLPLFLAQPKKGGKKAGNIAIGPELPDDLALVAGKLGFCRPRLCRNL
jgi:hypothetical protein